MIPVCMGFATRPLEIRVIQPMFDTENDFELSSGNNASELENTSLGEIKTLESPPLSHLNTKEPQSLGSEFDGEQIARSEIAISDGDKFFSFPETNASWSDFSIADNSLDDAVEIAVGESPAVYSDWVGSSDRHDYYRFSLEESSQLDLSLSGLSSDADIALLDSSGNELFESTNAGSSNETIHIQLSEGVYYLDVYAYSIWSETNYDLTVSATANNDPGNNLDNATDITVGEDPTTYSDWVGASDRDDYYRFSLDESSRVNLSVTGLSDDADVQILDSSGNQLFESSNSASNDETINAQLTAGTYFIRVFAYTSFDNTEYDLTISTSVTEDPGNTLDEAKEIVIGEDSTTFNEWVGSSDRNDYYRFSIDESKNLNLSLSGLSSDADVQLLDDAGSVVAQSTNSGSNSEAIEAQLGAGTYYIRVNAYLSFDNTDYSLTVSANTIPVVPGYSSVDGFGLVNASTAVARATGQSDFADVPDLGGNDWGADLVEAPEVWSQGYTGEGVVVAVLDTGVDRNHSDLSDNIYTNSGEIEGDGIDNDGNGYVDDFYGWNFTDNSNDTTDRQSHGTHVAGTIAGVNNGVGVTGIAYDAQIMPVKVLDDSGSGSYESIANGIRYAADNGADVINMSLGGDTPSEEMRSAIEYAAGLGSIVVMASGNDGDSTTMGHYPASYATDWGIAVGAVDRYRDVASFTNRAGINPLTYVTAPGVSVYSTVPNNGYDSYDGTSMATPHVAGVVALMLDANPDLTESQVSDILTSTAQSSGNSIDINSINNRATYSVGIDALFSGVNKFSVREIEPLGTLFTTANSDLDNDYIETTEQEIANTKYIVAETSESDRDNEISYNDTQYDPRSGLMSMEQVGSFVTLESLEAILTV